MKIKIPRLFHVIWAGGERKLPLRNIAVILSWMQKHPRLVFWLWVDKKTDPTNLEEFYTNVFEEIKKQENIKVSLTGRLFIKDITEEGIVDKYIRYEIDRLRSNFGASSDMVRYKAVYENGGALFDSDVGPGEESLEDDGIFDEEYEDHVLFVDTNGQDAGAIGNDAFISTPRNPLLARIIELVQYNYHYHEANNPYVCRYGIFGNIINRQLQLPGNSPAPLFGSIPFDNSIARNIFSFLDYKALSVVAPLVSKIWYKFSQEHMHYTTIEDSFSKKCTMAMKAYLFDQPAFIMDITVKLTGFHPVGLVARPYLGRKTGICVKELKSSYRKAIREIGMQWVNYPVRRCGSKDAAIATILESIKFELEVMKILRLEDHVENLASATGCSIPSAINDLLAVLSKTDFDFRKAEAVQNTLRYTSITQFYQDCFIEDKKYVHFNFDQITTNMSGVNCLHIREGILQVERIKKLSVSIREKQFTSDANVRELIQIVNHGAAYLNRELDRMQNKLTQLTNALLHSPDNNTNLMNNINKLDSYLYYVLRYAAGAYEDLLRPTKASKLKPLPKKILQKLDLKQIDTLMEKIPHLQHQFEILRRGSLVEESAQPKNAGNSCAAS